MIYLYLPVLVVIYFLTGVYLIKLYSLHKKSMFLEDCTNRVSGVMVVFWPLSIALDSVNLILFHLGKAVKRKLEK